MQDCQSSSFRFWIGYPEQQEVFLKTVAGTQFFPEKKCVPILVLILIVKKNMYRFRYTKNFSKKMCTDFGTDINREKKCVPVWIFPTCS
jgi:hypothetical protein